MKKVTRLLIRAAREGNVQLASALIDSYGLSHHPEWSNGYKFLRIAVENNKTDFVELLLSKGCSVNEKKKSLLYTPLHFAVRNKNIEIVELLLSKGADVNVKYRCGSSLLHFAVKNKRKKVVQLLISAKAEIDSIDSFGRPPIFYSVENDDLKMTQLLLSSGANVRDFPKVLHAAVLKNSIEIIDALLLNGADVNAVDEYGRSALYFTVFKGSSEITHIDFERNNVYENNYDFSPSSIRSISTVQHLLNKGANIDAQTNAGITIFHGSLYMALNPIPVLLLENNANVHLEDCQGTTTLHISAHRGDKYFSGLLLERGVKVNAKLKNGTTPLHLAVAKGSTEVVKLLLGAGAQVNCQRLDGTAPLHLARHSKIITTLLNCGANVNAIREDGKTALHLRSTRGETHAVALLLRFGADINIKSKHSETALDCTSIEEDGEESESDSEDEWSFGGGRTIDESRRELVRHKIKMEAIGLHTEESWLAPRYEEKLKKFRKRCEEEITKMKKKVIKGTTVSYYEILRKNTRALANYMKNENVVMVSHWQKYRIKYPCYASMIKCQFRRGSARNKLLKHASQVFNSFVDLPDVCVDKILDYLDDEDLAFLADVAKLRS